MSFGGIRVCIQVNVGTCFGDSYVPFFLCCFISRFVLFTIYYPCQGFSWSVSLFGCSPEHLRSTIRSPPQSCSTLVGEIISQDKTLLHISHILTYPHLHSVVCRLGSGHANVFCLLPSQSSSGFWSYPLSPGLAISALFCLDLVFHLLSCVISFWWPHIYLVHTMIV